MHYYGISIEQYEEMSERQSHKCALCRRAYARTLHVDHCHETGDVRGLLCNNCNTGIGLFEESIVLFRAATAYLEKYKRRPDPDDDFYI